MLMILSICGSELLQLEAFKRIVDNAESHSPPASSSCNNRPPCESAAVAALELRLLRLPTLTRGSVPNNRRRRTLG